MIRVRIYGKRETKNIYKMRDLRKIGLLYVLLESCNGNEVDNVELKNKFGIEISEVKHLLIEAQQLNVLKVETQMVDSQILLNVEFISENLETNGFDVLTDAFGVSKHQISELVNISAVDGQVNYDTLGANLISLFNRIQMPVMIKNAVINSQSDLVHYLDSAYIQDIFNSWNTKPSSNDYLFLYELLVVDKMEKGVVNLLVDYVIKTNTYNNFNIAFAKKVSSTWKNKNITSIASGITFLNEMNTIMKNKRENGKYQAPLFEEVAINVDILPSDLEMREIIKNVYNK